MHKTICDYISDIIQNSIEAGATLINMDVNEDDQQIEIIIKDNGKGMDKLTLKKALDPFYTDDIKKHQRNIGLGLPFILQAIEQSKGQILIQSEKEKGTSVKFIFLKNNIDTPPFGDKIITYLSLFNYPGNYNLAINEHKGKESSSFSKKEIEDILGNISSTHNLNLLKKFLKDNIL